MANNSNATIVEQELPHEIYASLVKNSSSHTRHTSIPICNSSRDAAAAADAADTSQRRHSHLNINGNRAAAAGDATLIPADATDEDNSKQPSSQFIKFYRRSCQAQLQQHSNVAGISSSTVRKPKSQTRSTASAGASTSTKPQPCKHSTTTKAERRRMARQERQRQIQKDKRVRMMLRSDFSEEDELLYRRLAR